jgi:Zn-dependent protease
MYGCPRCGNYLAYGQLACNRCGALVYSDRLNQISTHATQLEQTDPAIAALVWRQALDLLPQDARQAQFVRDRIRALEGGAPVELGYQARPGTQPVPVATVPRNDTWSTAILKTGGSMLISIVLYAMLFGQTHGLTFGVLFATGFVLLILVHELGHSFAMRHFGLSASPPIFIPFMGALINLRQQPRNAWEEAVVGIGGPALGTLGAIFCHAMYLFTGAELLLLLAFFGYMLNLFNLLPVPPLDGGRITAAVSPWIWMPGLLGLVWMIIYQWQVTGRPSVLLLLLLFLAWPRVLQTLRGRRRGEASPYYDIGRRAQWTMAVYYVGLGMALMVLFYVARVGLIAMGTEPML